MKSLFLVKHNRGARSSKLLEVEVDILPTIKCKRPYGSDYYIKERMICAGKLKGGADACQVCYLS